MNKSRKITTIAMLSAIAFILVLIIRIPLISFITYDPKDVIIVIGGFIFGPLAAVIISVISSFIEMVTVSGTGVIGFVMNVLSSCSFAIVASFVYKKRRTMNGAVAGLICGVIGQVIIMLLWNFIITPLYMGVPRGDVAAMLIPVFLPANLIKGSLNAAITMLVYKPLVSVLRRANLIPKGTIEGKLKSSVNIKAVVISLVVIVICVIAVLLVR